MVELYPDVSPVRLQLQVNEPLEENDASTTSKAPTVWHPSDRLEGALNVHSLPDVTIESIIIHLEGITRIWTTFIDLIGNFTRRKASFKFLVQSQDDFDIGRLKRLAPNESGCNIPFTFVISERCLDQHFDIPGVCLNLPPSFQAGRVLANLRDPQQFAQPNISYHIRAKITWRSAVVPGIRTSEILQKIEVKPYTEMQPPTHTHDFPEDFRESITNALKPSLLSSRHYALRVAMQEPPAVQLGRHSSGIPAAQLDVDVSTIVDEAHTKNGPQFRQNLEKIIFKVNLGLKTKTFYATAPLSTIPSKALLTNQSHLRLIEDISKMTPVKMKPDHWHFLPSYDEVATASACPRPNPSEVECTFCVDNIKHIIMRSDTYHPPGRWTASLNIPLQVPSDLPPTFCSAIAARQYSLVARVKVSGANVKPFELELPLQVVYPPPSHIENATPEAGNSTDPTDPLSAEQVFDTDQQLPDEPPRYFVR